MFRTLFVIAALLGTFAVVANAAATVDTGNGYTVTLVDYHYDAGDDATYFSYRVCVATTAPHDVSHFALELCDTLTIVPSSVNVDGSSVSWDDRAPTSLLNSAIKWDVGVNKGECKVFTAAVEGNIVMGTTGAFLKAGQLGHIARGFAQLGGTIDGPSCNGTPPSTTLSITGGVFLDANCNGGWDVEELGVPNVTVNLLDGAGNVIATTTTDSNGDYLFDNLTSGNTYSVEIPTGPAGSENGTLDTYFNQSVPAGGSYTFDPLTSTQTGANFGYCLCIPCVSTPGDGRSPGFWTSNVGKSLGIIRGRAQISYSEMAGYLYDVEALFHADPYDFGAGSDDDRLGEAFMILNGSGVVDQFYRHLLAVEFNEVSGNGLTGEYAMLQTYVIMVAESMAQNLSAYTMGEIEDMKDVLDSFTGGGE